MFFVVLLNSALIWFLWDFIRLFQSQRTTTSLVFRQEAPSRGQRSTARITEGTDHVKMDVKSKILKSIPKITGSQWL